MPWHRPRDPRVPVGHASLIASLRQAGVETVAQTFSLNVPRFDAEAVIRFVLGAAEGLGADRVDLGIGAYIWNEHVVQRLLPTLRARGFHGRIILGGPQISYSGAGLEQLYPEADVFVRGYGEDALVRLAGSRGRRAIPGGPRPVYEPIAAKGSLRIGSYRFVLPEDLSAAEAITVELSTRVRDDSEYLDLGGVTLTVEPESKDA
ncbi:MAG: cobalamin B12-binding domain-containing protein [Proteobacteria bacterium]|nr:cobalamin B12-binding domain-containing protein [Pseudomonadota bacterium]